MRHGEQALLLVALLAGALVGGCGANPALDDATTNCTPGRAKSCGCSDGAFGAQSCLDDGTYAACVCTVGGSGSGGSGSGGSGGGSGAGGAGGGGGAGGAGGGGGTAAGGDGGWGGSAASRCPGGVLQGDASIRRAADLAAIVGCTEITGHLDVNAADLGALSLPALTSVGSHLLLQRQRSLVSVELPALVSVGGTFRLDGAAGLTTLALPALTSVGEFGIMADPGSTAALAGLSLPSLVSVIGDFGVASTRLGDVELPRLSSVGGGFSWEANAELGSLSSPRLVSVGRSLRIGGNGALTSLSLPVLTSVGGEFNVSGNTSLPTCAAQAILDRLLAAGFSGSVFLSGNDDTGSCP